VDYFCFQPPKHDVLMFQRLYFWCLIKFSDGIWRNAGFVFEFENSGSKSQIMKVTELLEIKPNEIIPEIWLRIIGFNWSS
jgi:hypothetical protein